MDERRIKRTGELLEEYANVEAKVMPIIQKCLDNMKDNGKSVNGQQVLISFLTLQLPEVINMYFLPIISIHYPANR